ncbi:hypothetical protein H0H93_007876 [Arthromyces matolae]|nr:hypothetical protein H0H93_007876 [Arthromyces matolae]
MSSDPTPPPPGDNSLASCQNYEAKAVEKDREADRETIDKMLAFQKQFGESVIAVFELEVLRCFKASPSNSPSRPPMDGPSSSLAGPSLSVIPEVVVDPSLLPEAIAGPFPPSSIPIPVVPPAVDSSSAEVLPPPPEPVASSKTALASDTVQVSESIPPLPSVPKRSTGPRRMSSKPDVTAADRKRINLEMEKTGPSRAQLLQAAEKVGSLSESWWKEHSPCQKCGPQGDCIPHFLKNLPLKSCKYCNNKRIECSIKVTWQMLELARLHSDWPLWWIQERINDGWLKKPRGGKVEAEPKAGSLRTVPSKADCKGKRKAEPAESSSESSSQDADGDTDSEAAVEVVERPLKRLRGEVASPSYRPYSQPPGPLPLPGRPMAKPLPSKPSKVREVYVLVPPLTTSQVSRPVIPDPLPPKPKVPLFAPSETPEVVIVSPPPSKPAPSFIPDPKSPLNIRIPPRPPRLPSPPAGTSLRRSPPPSPDLETRNQVFEGTRFSSGDVLRGRLADARRQSLVLGRGLHHLMASSSAWSLQWESIRRECQERGFELSPANARYMNHAVDDSCRLSLDMADILNEADCELMRVVKSGRNVPEQQELIDEMDREGMDVGWEQ